jgi:hypothetical protein
LDFAQRAEKHGIQIEWMIFRVGGYLPDAPTRPAWPPGPGRPRFFEGHPLSSADPEQFRSFFSSLLGKLEASGITLAGFELGNEINLSSNPDFPLPGKGGVQLGLNDLNNDPEGQQIARGYLQYLKLLAVLKDIRDHSKLNQQTPIMTAGLGSYQQDDGPLPKGNRFDVVSVNATLQYMRSHGLDNLVDGYAIHVYPHAGETPAERKEKLAKYDFTLCRAAGSRDGKPCWLTEWGFKNKDMNCPINDSDRAGLVREMMGDFRPYVKQARLVGLLWFSWNGTAGSDNMMGAVWRCGSLTPSGKLSVDSSLLK